MKIVEGFRIPEPTDGVIQWPARGTADPITAIYYKSSATWMIPGSAHAFGDARALVTRFGNDWYSMYMDRSAEAAQ